MKLSKHLLQPNSEAALHNSKKDLINNNSDSHYCQNLLPIQEITHGMIHTDDGRYVKILEILPINFKNKSIEEQNNIGVFFSSLFSNCHKLYQIKMITDSFNPYQMIENLKSVAKHESNLLRLKTINNYIKKARQLSAQENISSRFFIIYEYEPLYGEKKSNNIQDIYTSMMVYRNTIISTLSNCENLIVDAADYNFEQGEILYKLLNRKSSRTESLQQRIDRLSTDMQMYSINHDTSFSLDDLDCISSRGTYFKGTWWYICDGEYVTHLTIQEKTYPQNMYAGWLAKVLPGAGYDIDIFIEKKNHGFMQAYALNASQNANNSLKTMHFKLPSRVSNLNIKRNALDRVYKSLQNGSELLDCCTVFTIRANSLRTLSIKKMNLLSNLQKNSIRCEETFANAEEYYKMTLPLCNFKNSIFSRNSRNFLSEDMGAFYFFTSYEFIDESGYVLGINLDTNSIIGLDPSNTQKFPNCHMLLLGGTGSGKTYTQCLIAEGESFIGNRVFLILPYKAFEYYPMVTALNGIYINMADPKVCLNFWEIRPDGLSNKVTIDADTILKSISLLTKKITDMIIFYSMLMDNHTLTSDEESHMNISIKRMYLRFGITDDNDSIYENKSTGLLKTMPTFSDFYEEIKDDPYLARIVNKTQTFVEGSYSYLNGQTNVNLNGNVIAFDVDKNNIDERILAPIMYMIFQFLYSLCTSDLLSMDTFIIDEAWYLLLNDICAKRVNEMLTIIRGFGAHAVLALQNLSDLLKSNYADSILNLTKIKFVLKCEDTKILRERLEISANDANFLKRCSRGSGLLLTSGETMHIHFQGSEYETMLFTTDLNERKRLVKKLLKLKQNVFQSEESVKETV